MGYHLIKIQRGKYGEVSKIEEELNELKDATQQGNRIMELVELSDLIGAIKGYMKTYHSEYDINDLIIMADATERSFKDGTRQPQESDVQ